MTATPEDPSVEHQRRKALGRRIKRARRAAGFRSQQALAEAIGAHERSVAGAELGEWRTGDAIFSAIERVLGWPEDSTRRYLETGDDTVLSSSTPEPQPQRHDMAQVAINALAEMEVLGADATTYNRSLDAWEVILKRHPVEFDTVRREARRRAAEILAERNPDNPGGAQIAKGGPIPPNEPPVEHDLVRSAVLSLRDHELAGVDATTYNRHLDKWARILAVRNPDVSIDEVRQEASRRAAEILANRRPDNPASATR